MNKTILTGKVSRVFPRDATRGGTAAIKFGMSVDDTRPGQQQPFEMLIDLKAFGKAADAIADLALEEGDYIEVDAALQKEKRKFGDKDVWMLVLVAREVKRICYGAANGGGYTEPSHATSDAAGDDIPF